MPSTDNSPLTTAATLTGAETNVWSATAPAGSDRVEIELPEGPAFVADGSDELFVLPSDAETRHLVGSGRCWVLPTSPTSTEPAWLIEAAGPITATLADGTCRVVVEASTATITRHRARPHADVEGNAFQLDIQGGDELADAAAGFYWGTMLPSIIERTTAAGYPDGVGYVVSTLAERYLGTYPDVDHEFQIKGRLAWGSRTDQDVTRRMMELQLRMMREDPIQLWRDPCAVQPDGTREYHVRRNSADGTENAEMFLVTGNVEVLEAIWMYIARTKDLAWLGSVIADVEGAASGIETYIDTSGRLWGDVYYEDQVIKDGRETMAQALAVRSFELLAELEDLLERAEQAGRYRTLAKRLASSLAEPLPAGWWDRDERRFVDWVDRSGKVHDHVHLLANILPVLVGATTPEQESDVLALIERELPEFQRFPTFLSSRVADYTDDEIGDGGPYDLCAAGRYWCWDAAFWRSRGDGAMLLDQLTRVARMGASEDYIMGERYDMNHVYYIDGSPWHGAAHYYEYPCVFSWVLFHEYVGVRGSLDADLQIAPALAAAGSVTLGQQAYQLRYTYADDRFVIENLAATDRTYRVDLSRVFPAGTAFQVEGGDAWDGESVITVAPGAAVTLVPVSARA